MADSTQWEIRPPVMEAKPLGLRDALQFLLRNFFIIGSAFAIGVALGITVQKITPKAYESQGRFVVNELPYGMESTDAETERQLVQTLIESLPSRDLQTAISQTLGVDPKRLAFEDLDLPIKLQGPIPKASIAVTAAKNSRFGLVQVTSQDPEFAARVANAILDETKLYNQIGGRLKDIKFSLELDKSKADTLVKQLVDVSSQCIKLQNENSELDDYIHRGLPLSAFPSFATDATLNNLKTQLVLVKSQWDSLAATSTRGANLAGKRAELDSLESQVTSHCKMLSDGLRSQLQISTTQESTLATGLKQTKDQIDQITQLAAVLSQSLGDPLAMRKLAEEASATGPRGQADVIAIVNRADPVLKPVKPKLWLNLGLGIVLGGGLGLGISILRAVLDNRLRSAAQIENRSSQPCLALLPARPASRSRSKRRSIVGHEHYPIELGYLRSHLLQIVMEPKSTRVIGFTPARQGQSASEMIADLAIMLAQSEKRTLIVDLHLTAPRLAGLLGIEVRKGLAGWLASEDPISEYVSYSVVRELGLLAIEDPNADMDQLLPRRPISLALREELEKWDLILIDSPCILFDWSLTMALPTGAPLIVVAEYNRTTADDVLQIVNRAQGSRWDMDGVVLLDMPRHKTRKP